MLSSKENVKGRRAHLVALVLAGVGAVVLVLAVSLLSNGEQDFSHRYLLRSTADDNSTLLLVGDVDDNSSSIQENNNSMVQDDEIDEEVLLRPLLPLQPSDYVGFIAAILGLMLAAGGGIGGGGLLVPIYILILGFPVKHAVSLSNVTVFGGAIANTLLNAPKRHPSPLANNRPLIDWNLMVMMEPLTMAGALIGADLNEFLPDVMLVIMLVLLLGFTTIRTLKKANKMHDLESKNKNAKGYNKSQNEEGDTLLEVAESPRQALGALSYGTKDSSDSKNMDDDNSSSVSGTSAELARLVEQESNIPWTRIFELSGLFLVVVGLNMLKGSGGKLEWLSFEVKCGSAAFYWLEKSNLVLIVLFALYIRRELIRETAHKQALRYQFAPGDVVWNGKNTLQYSSICSVAGLFAGLFGIGGGVVKSPLMLEMGVPPAVASATSATMILFTSFTATTSYVVYGELNFHYARVCVLVGFGSTIIGQLLMQALLAKYNRNSLIAYSIALVVGISALAMTVESVLAIAQGHSRQGAGMCTAVH